MQNFKQDIQNKNSGHSKCQRNRQQEFQVLIMPMSCKAQTTKLMFLYNTNKRRQNILSDHKLLCMQNPSRRIHLSYAFIAKTNYNIQQKNNILYDSRLHNWYSILDHQNPSCQLNLISKAVIKKMCQRGRKKI